jgi:transposase
MPDERIEVSEGFPIAHSIVLVPTSRPGDIAVIDKLGNHKGKTVRAAIRPAGVHLLFPPPYSPDLISLEQVSPS